MEVRGGEGKEEKREGKRDSEGKLFVINKNIFIKVLCKALQKFRTGARGMVKEA